MQTSFFLGSNSGSGFYSFYKELINLKEAKAVYILKGCPGCGKSSLMKTLASHAENEGLDVERIFCSSDPDSLDGVIFPELGTAIVDGTAPHVVEPEFPLAVEQYINLGNFVDVHALSQKRDEIITTIEHYSTFRSHIRRLMTCAEHLENELFNIVLQGISIEKLHRKAQGIISREICGHGKNGVCINRFLSSNSFKGNVCLFNENCANFERNFLIEDSYGIAQFIFAPVIEACINSKFKCIICRNPLNPEKIDHLLVPELSLAFFTVDKETDFQKNYYKKIRLDAMIDRDVLKNHKTRISLLQKTKKAVLNDAFTVLNDAKCVHDKIEALYKPYINFSALNDYTSKLSEEIFKSK